MSADILKIKVAIVDDHPLVIEGIKSLLQPYKNIKVVGSLKTGEEALTFFKQNPVDVVLLDINLPDLSGIDICKKLHQNHKDIAAIALSTYCDRSMVNQMIANGAKGYLLKNVTEAELIEAINKVYRGGCYYGVEIQKIMASSILQNVGETPKITTREHQVLEKIVAGKTTNTIAEELCISPLTVETHRRNLMKKLNVPNVAALVKIAMDKMLV